MQFPLLPHNLQLGASKLDNKPPPGVYSNRTPRLPSRANNNSSSKGVRKEMLHQAEARDSDLGNALTGLNTKAPRL